MNPPPNRSPKPGHQWEVCPTCNGKGQIIGRMQSELGGKTTRCPRCFRNGWVEAPLESKKAASEETTPLPHQPRSDWLEGLDVEEERQESSRTRPKSEREVHGANCNCRSCNSLRKGYARSRKSGKHSGSASQRYVKSIALPLTFAAIIAALVALSHLAFQVNSPDSQTSPNYRAETSIIRPPPHFNLPAASRHLTRPAFYHYHDATARAEFQRGSRSRRR